MKHIKVVNTQYLNKLCNLSVKKANLKFYVFKYSMLSF